MLFNIGHPTINFVLPTVSVAGYLLNLIPLYSMIVSMISFLWLVETLVLRVNRVLDDMDSRDTTLITEEGDCSQEMVNLLLCGKAASNIFNDCMEVTVGLGKTLIMKGIPGRCDIGLLSLREHNSRRIQVSQSLNIILPHFTV